MRNIVSGGAGFLGSHLVEKLMNNGDSVICIDNLLTGNINNISKWINNSRFTFINHDVVNYISLDVDNIWHLACPASPFHYQEDPFRTSEIIFLGTYNMLKLAKECNAKFILASSSEVYGEPLEHPQSENYSGSVNTTGYRSCYEEGKRLAESITKDFANQYRIDVKIARIFNTYGPRMQISDGRVISNFICQALKGHPLTIFGDGNNTRSFCYVDELIDGLYKLMFTEYNYPVNLGNPEEYSIIELAKIIIGKIDQNLVIKNLPKLKDDPMRRKPDINLANNLFGWSPSIDLNLGLDKTITYFNSIIYK